MPIALRRVLVEGFASPPGQQVTLTDQATGTVLGTAISDPTTGAFSIPVPFQLFLQGLAAGRAAATGALVPGALSGAAPGIGGAAAELARDQALAGQAPGAGGAAGGAISEVPLSGPAAGHAEAGAEPTVSGVFGGVAPGAGGGSGQLARDQALAGAAAGQAAAGPTTVQQQVPVSGVGAGVGGATGQVAGATEQLEVVSSTSGLSTDGRVISVMIPQIPPNAVVVVAGTSNPTTTDGVTSGNLTYANRQRTQGAGTASIFTAVNQSGNTLHNEIVTYDAGAAGLWPAVTVTVLRGASITHLSTVGGATGTAALFSVGVTCGGLGSYVVGCAHMFSGAYSATPTEGSTELADQPDATHGRGHWKARSTNVNGRGDPPTLHVVSPNPVSIGGTLTVVGSGYPIVSLGGTWSSAGSWTAAAIEIRQAGLIQLVGTAAAQAGATGYLAASGPLVPQNPLFESAFPGSGWSQNGYDTAGNAMGNMGAVREAWTPNGSLWSLGIDSVALSFCVAWYAFTKAAIDGASAPTITFDYYLAGSGVPAATILLTAWNGATFVAGVNIGANNFTADATAHSLTVNLKTPFTADWANITEVRATFYSEDTGESPATFQIRNFR